jgi:hypothetical protein
VSNMLDESKLSWRLAGTVGLKYEAKMTLVQVLHVSVHVCVRRV